MNNPCIEFQNLKHTIKSNFLDYVYGGCEINLSVAIDFSEGNGRMDDPDCLHYLKSGDAGNKYLQAIKSVVTIMQYYNTTKMIAAYGYGAQVVQNHETSHCFALNGDIFNPSVPGIEGLMRAYERCLKAVNFGENARFSEVVDTVMKRAEGSRVN